MLEGGGGRLTLGGMIANPVASSFGYGGFGPAGTNFTDYDRNAGENINRFFAQAMAEQPMFNRQMAEQHWASQLAADTHRYAVDRQVSERQRQFNKAFHQLKGQMGVAGMMGGGPVGGPQPTITAGPVWNENQIQSRVNAQRALNDQSLATKERQIGETMAGRGFASSSPLISALQGQAFAANLGANTLGENDLRWNAAQGNAQHLLASQQAQEGQYASRQQENIGRRGISAGSYNALINALSGLAR